MGARLLPFLTVAMLGLAGLPVAEAAPDLRETRIRVRASAAEVVVLTPVTLTGRVNGDRRIVELEIRDAQGWRRLDWTRTDELGSFTFEAPTGWYGKKRLRVTTRETRTHDAGKVLVALKVVPEYQPVGDADAWKNNGGRVRYNPCEPVLFAVNPSLLPPDGMAALQEALFRIEKASGLRFRYQGTTGAVPFRTDAGRTYSSQANLTVAWSTPTVNANFEPTTLGTGGTMRTKFIRGQRTQLLVKSGIAMNSMATFPWRSFENGRAMGVVHMHLLGLALGLGQVAAEDQIMHQIAYEEKPPQFGRGDLTGLSMHGLDQGCLEPTKSSRPISRFAVSQALSLRD